MSLPRIGISACFFHSDPKRPVFKGKTLLYLEQSLAHWVLGQDVLAFMIPSVGPDHRLRLGDLADSLDGLILQGGSDVAPESYEAQPLRPEWGGDIVRDRYEMELFREFHARGKPVLGVCRGLQLLNVALGGTLYQDIATEVPTAGNHRDWDLYDANFHDITFEKDARLHSYFPGQKGGKVNTVHHQAIRDLGRGLSVEARANGDGIIEAVRLEDPNAGFVYGMQWHPEFQDPADPTLLNCVPVLQDFLRHAAQAANLPPAQKPKATR